MAAVNSDGTTLLMEYLANIQSYTATFKQTVKDEQGKTLDATYGTVKVLKPGRFKWVLNEPTQQIMVADGKRLWIYDIDLEQITVYDQAKQLAQTPALLLSDNPNDLLKRYHVRSLNHAGTRFRMEPNDHESGLVGFILEFKDKIIQRLEIIDQMAQHTTLEFKDIRINQPINLNIFNFKAPHGVDVIDNR